MSEAERLDARVGDLLALVRRGGVLRPAGPLAEDGAHVIDAFDEAVDHARRRYVTAADDAPNWRDLRAREASRLLGVTYADPAMAPVRAAVRGLGQRLADDVRLPLAYEAAFTDVVADLQNIALSRVVAASEGLFERMWRVYSAGGWPCGWEGPYPEGRLVVFQPGRTAA